MKTLLFAPLFMDSEERLERNIQWIQYIATQPLNLAFSELYYVDNASTPKYLERFKEVLKSVPFNVTIHECKTRLERGPQHQYPYWYSAFAKGVKYAKANGFNKLLHIDTDVYLFNNRITTYVNNLDKGWSAPWCTIHNFPETTFQVICQDQFEIAEEFYVRDFLKFYPIGMAETNMPYTNVFRCFVGDRYGEKNLEQTPEMDYYGQKPNNIKVVFNV